MLRRPQPKHDLIRQMGGKPKTSPLNPDVVVVPALGTRKVPFEPETDDERDRILRVAMTHLSEYGVSYIPLDVQEDIRASYDADSVEEFRKTVRGWMRELRASSKRGAA